MFDNLSDKLDKALHVLKGHGQITEINVAETTKEVRRALLDADVNFKIAKEFTNRVKEKALGQNVLTTLQPGQLMVKIVKDELTQLMGGESEGINLSGNPSVILMVIKLGCRFILIEKIPTLLLLPKQVLQKQKQMGTMW